MTRVKIVVAELEAEASELQALLSSVLQLTHGNGTNPVEIPAPSVDPVLSNTREVTLAAQPNPDDEPPVRRRSKRRVINSVGGGGSRRSEKPKSTPAPAPPGRGGLTAEQLKQAKQLWLEGKVSAAAIGAKVGKGPTWAYAAAKANGWGKRRSAAPAPKTNGLAERICRNCLRKTSTNPCDKCFEKAA